MKLIALALALTLALPAVAAKESEPEYPAAFLALVPGWIAEAEALVTEEDRTRPWWPEAEGFLAKAKDAQEAGRLRIAMFQLETYYELAVSNKLVDEANATRSSDAERKAFIIGRTAGMRADTERAWEEFRASAHGYDAQLRSLQTIEKVLYAGDVALIGILGLQGYDEIAPEFPKQPGVPLGYVLALVRAAHSSGLNIGWASQMLTEAVKEEGLPPRVEDEGWANLSAAALAIPEGEVPSYLQDMARLGDEARNNSEVLLSIVFSLAEQRASRAYGMYSIFGDAESRAKDVVTDSARGMNIQLNNTTLDEPRGHGLTGVFTSDAIDRARYANEFLAAQKGDLGIVINAWSALEHARYVTAALAAASPITPPPTPTDEETPGMGALLVLAIVVAAAFAQRRRR